MLVHRAVTLTICPPWDLSLFLAVKRPRENPDSPGEWGIPAFTLFAAETINDGIGRIGKSKLGVCVDLGPVLSCELQHHPSHTFHLAPRVATLEDATAMISLCETSGRYDDTRSPTMYGHWQGAHSTVSTRSATTASLCCQLLLRVVSRNT
jgi:hypothetical protein